MFFKIWNRPFDCTRLRRGVNTVLWPYSSTARALRIAAAPAFAHKDESASGWLWINIALWVNIAVDLRLRQLLATHEELARRLEQVEAQQNEQGQKI